MTSPEIMGERQVMRAIDRVRVGRQIIATFQQQMSVQDAHLFFSRMQVPRPQLGSSYSMETLIRKYLDSCSDETLLDIAHQLDVDLPTGIDGGLIRLGDSKYWRIDHFRMFISHVHTAKAQAGGLRHALQWYAISAFVAHEDIDTSDEWREEILRSLLSMDAFVAIITPDFNSSKWTDQEVGIAVARGVLMIPINTGENPYGFLSKYQALPGKGLRAKDVAGEVFRTICSNASTRDRMIESLTRTISTGSDISEVLFRIDKLNGIEGVGIEDWERVRENVAGNAVLRSSQPVLDALNRILQERELTTIESRDSKPEPSGDDIPF